MFAGRDVGFKGEARLAWVLFIGDLVLLPPSYVAANGCVAVMLPHCSICRSSIVSIEVDQGSERAVRWIL